ncbi:hypothetical protein FB451DRAFT_1442309 [Mycena latifolia]|nr:hypothetical protein FB451DRAFT_1442309 [Mycena latifolia]
MAGRFESCSMHWLHPRRLCYKAQVSHTGTTLMASPLSRFQGNRHLPPLQLECTRHHPPLPSTGMSLLDEYPFLPGFYTTSFVDAVRDLSSLSAKVLHPPSNETQCFETATNDIEAADLFTESLDKWGTSCDQLFDLDAASAALVIPREPESESPISTGSKCCALTRPYAGNHLSMGMTSVPFAPSLTTSPSPSVAHESFSCSSHDFESGAEASATVPLEDDTHAASYEFDGVSELSASPSDLSSVDPQELSNQYDVVARVEDADEPPSTVPVPSVRVTIPLPKRSSITLMSSSSTFNVTAAQDADSEADDGADSDYVEAHTIGLKRRAPSSKPKAALKHRAPKRQRGASPLPPPPANIDSEYGQTASSTPSPIAITVGSLTQFKCPASHCTHPPLNTAGGITRHYWATHLGLRRACPLCGKEFESPRNDVVKRHLKHTCKAPQELRAQCIAELPAKKRKVRA